MVPDGTVIIGEGENRHTTKFELFQGNGIKL